MTLPIFNDAFWDEFEVRLEKFIRANAKSRWADGCRYWDLYAGGLSFFMASDFDRCRYMSVTELPVDSGRVLYESSRRIYSDGLGIARRVIPLINSMMILDDLAAAAD